MASSNISLEITTHLSTKGLYPTETWLQAFLAAARPSTPLPALRQTAVFRLTSTDITTTLNHRTHYIFPADILDATTAQRRLPGPIAVQILSIHDVGHSAWSQLEALEAAERGETTKGREVVRVVPGEDGLAGPMTVGGTGGPYKLVLQDARGMRVFGFELATIAEFGLGMQIGAKMVLRDVAVARGVLMLEPACVTWLGGKIESVHAAWVAGRKAELRSAAGVMNVT